MLSAADHEFFAEQGYCVVKSAVPARICEAVKREAWEYLAKHHGVDRLVLLSGRGEEGAQRCEDIVLGVAPHWTVVRASWFNQNFSEGHFLPGIQQGALALPAGSVREPFIDVEDIADVAVAALTSDGHEGQFYEVTGPRLLTFAEAVAEIAEATGRQIEYQQIATQDYVGAATAQGAPKEIADLLTFLFDTVLDGRNESVADGVQRALGRPPRDFRDYAQRLAAAGIPCTPTHANFVLAGFGSTARAEAADAFLKSRGLIVRRTASYGLPDRLRISIGDEAGCRAVAEALEAFMASGRAEA